MRVLTLRYLETKEQSAEILRLILPLMAKQVAAYHPLSYALWYEHAAGINPPLSRFLEERLSGNAPIDEAEVRRLYAHHIAARDIEASERLQGELRVLLEDTAENAVSASLHAEEFEHALDVHARRLADSVDRDTLREIVATLTEQVAQMRAATGELSTTLRSRAEGVSKLMERFEEAQREALLDPLTGLKNRRGFERAVRQLDDCGKGLAGSSLVIADIDHFKQVNDTHGHLLGDKVIRAVAHVLRTNIKGRDIAVRLGGEEFAVLLLDTPLAGAASLAEQIRTSVAQGRIQRMDGKTFVGNVTVSLGVAFAEDSESLEALLARADAALYAAKRAGRNRVSLAESQQASMRRNA